MMKRLGAAVLLVGFGAACAEGLDERPDPANQTWAARRVLARLDEARIPPVEKEDWTQTQRAYLEPPIIPISPGASTPSPWITSTVTPPPCPPVTASCSSSASASSVDRNTSGRCTAASPALSDSQKIVFTVGTYNLVSTALNSWGVQLDEGLTGFPEAE